MSWPNFDKREELAYVHLRTVQALLIVQGCIAKLFFHRVFSSLVKFWEKLASVLQVHSIFLFWPQDMIWGLDFADFVEKQWENSPKQNRNRSSATCRKAPPSKTAAGWSVPSFICIDVIFPWIQVSLTFSNEIHTLLRKSKIV